jgi:sulfur transfer complex TusBCD TusB component (DsrH family)
VKAVATYFSMHIIACMTRQALRQLIDTLRAAQGFRFVRANASQMAGRLLCEFEAPDQDTLLRFLEEHHITHEWIIRAELSWQGDPTETTSAPAAAAALPPEASTTGSVATGGSPPLGRVGSSSPSSLAVEPQSAAAAPQEAEPAKILHILRSLQDESAWELITVQRQLQPVAVLLLHDAVLAPPPLEGPMYACETDVQARGISSSLPLLTYEQIIDMVFACERVMVW